MKKLFRIQNSSEPVQPVLLFQASEKHLAFAITNKNATELIELAYCSIENINLEPLNEFLNQYPVLKNLQFYDIQIAFSGQHAVFIPSAEAEMTDAEVVVKTQFGNYDGVRIVSEKIPEWQLYNAYAVENVLWDWVHTIFPFSKFRHQSTLSVKQMLAASDEGCLLVDFGTYSFSVLAGAGGKILFSNHCSYTTPEDVLFVLLKTCQQFSLSQQTVSVRLSGLIDMQSALYKELFQYFREITFREAGWHTGNTGNTEYPAHFFTSLNDLATCVS